MSSVAMEVQTSPAWSSEDGEGELSHVGGRRAAGYAA